MNGKKIDRKKRSKQYIEGKAGEGACGTTIRSFTEDEAVEIAKMITEVEAMVESDVSETCL